MKKTLALFFISTLTVFSASKKDVDERLSESASVLHEIMSTPDKGIPRDLLNNANCVVVIPGMKKGAFIVGAKYGKGFTSCRKERHGTWSAPAVDRSARRPLGGRDSRILSFLERHVESPSTIDPMDAPVKSAWHSH